MQSVHKIIITMPSVTFQVLQFSDVVMILLTPDLSVESILRWNDVKEYYPFSVLLNEISTYRTPFLYQITVQTHASFYHDPLIIQLCHRLSTAHTLPYNYACNIYVITSCTHKNKLCTSVGLVTISELCLPHHHRQITPFWLNFKLHEYCQRQKSY